MFPVSRRYLVIAALMLSSLALANLAKPTHRLAELTPRQLDSLIPKAFGDWTVDPRITPLLANPEQEALIKRIYAQTLSRTYVNRQGEHIMLSLAYSTDQSDSWGVHLPEVCYPAQGLPITANRERPLSTPFGTIPSRQLQANSPQRSEPITYWVMVGRYATASGTERKVAQMRYSLEGKIPDGLLVRVSSISRDTEAGYKLQNAFIADMLKAMPEPQRGALIGPPAL